MASKREEERNEKIIRGLMKLPPNRRCINCNSLGPQYVCANFRTFVCMICSGIHREFTHRVKSVSMSKFTSQEVEALQNGGNQRAREIFLKDWDFERQRLPNSSNVDKVREFIKAVYVDRKYAGGNKCDKPPSDMQGESNIGDETRRASSYHSYSQSPPYDFQYEDRLKRKQGGPFARKPGSGFHERKAVCFAYSPGRFGDYEDRFANEGSISRGSDYSVSSAGDPFRSGPQSPNLQKDEGFASPTIDSVRGIADVGQCQAASAQPEAYAKRDADRVPLPRPQRSISSGSFSSDGNSVSHHLMAPGSFIDAYSETKQSAGSPHNKTPKFSSFSKVSTENVAALDLFENPSGVPVSNSFPAPSSAPAIDSFQASAPSAAPANDLFQASATSAAATAAVAIDLFQASAPSSVPAIDLFQASAESSAPPQNFHQTSIPSVHQNLPEASDPCGEGWATFDLPQHNASLTNAHDAAVLGKQAEPGISSTNSNSVLTMTSEMQWPDFKSSVVHGPALSVSNPWDEGVQNFQMTVSKPNNKQQWKAFEEGNSQHQFVDLRQGTNVQISQVLAPSTTDQCFGHRILEGSGVGRFEKLPSSEGGSFSSLSSHVASGSSFNQPILPFMTETSLMRQKSVNPFDVDSELETSNGFLDMSNLQAALPAVPVQTPYVDGINESWFSSSPMVPQGGMPYITVPPSSSQLPNVTTHEPVASIGGNPFA